MYSERLAGVRMPHNSALPGEVLEQVLERPQKEDDFHTKAAG
jgi:hypothetical protein